MANFLYENKEGNHLYFEKFITILQFYITKSLFLQNYFQNGYHFGLLWYCFKLTRLHLKIIINYF